MKGLYAVLWREYLFFKRRFVGITASSMVSPILYLLTFGLGLGRSVSLNGVSYIDFLVPGIMALSTMNASFNAISMPLSIAKLYDKTLEEYIVAPITLGEFMAGKILAGALRGLYAAAVIFSVAMVFGAKMKVTVLFIMLLFLNCLVFAALGFWIALIIKTHTDMSRFNSFVITPMIFVCGTFFSLDKAQGIISQLINVLPLTPASHGLRALALGWELPFYLPLIQLVYLVVFIYFGYRAYSKAE